MNHALLLLPDFSLILCGYLLCRFTALNRSVWREVDGLVYYLLFPVLLFHSIVKNPIDWAATSALIAAMGGAEASVASLSAYYGNFYSESERAAITTANLTAQLADLGQAMPDTREAFRAMVDAAVAAGDTVNVYANGTLIGTATVSSSGRKLSPCTMAASALMRP